MAAVFIGTAIREEKTIMKKAIGICHGGGSSGDMSQTVESVTMYGTEKGYTVYGFDQAGKGIIEAFRRDGTLNDQYCKVLTVEQVKGSGKKVVSPITTRRFNPLTYQYQNPVDTYIQNVMALNIELLIGNGGDGSMGGFWDIAQHMAKYYPPENHFNIAIVIGSVDGCNGLDCTAGVFAASRKTAKQIIEISDDSIMNNRYNVISIMGQYFADLPAEVSVEAVKMGAPISAVLLPGMKIDLDELCHHLAKHPNSVIIMGEGVVLYPPFQVILPDSGKIQTKFKNPEHDVAGFIQNRMDQLRITVDGEPASVSAKTTGHTPRLGKPSLRCRRLADQTVRAAIDFHLSGERFFVVVPENESFVSKPIKDLVAIRPTPTSPPISALNNPLNRSRINYLQRHGIYVGSPL